MHYFPQHALFLVVVLSCVLLSSSKLNAGSFQFSSKYSGVGNTLQQKISLSCNDTSLQPRDEILKAEIVSNLPVIKHSSIYLVSFLQFLFYCTLGSAMPYIPLYYRYLGIPEDQIGFLGAITPAVTFLVSPLWGAIADVTGKHKEIMLLTFIGSIVSRCLLAFKRKNVFWLGLLVAASAVLNAPVKPLLDSAVMAILVDKADYGKTRLFGQLGFGFGSFIVGPFLSKDMSRIFMIHAALAVPTAAVMMSFAPKPQQDSKKKPDLKLGLLVALQNKSLLVFFLVVFLVGLSSGITENFAYVRISEVGGRGDVLGLLRLASSVAGCPFFWLAGYFHRALGTNGVLGMTLLAYSVRLFNYAAIAKPIHALPAEIIRGASFAVFWTSMTSHVYEKSPAGLTATMLGLLNAMYAGLGQSLGSLIGGGLSKAMGISEAFYLCSSADIVILVVFALYRLAVTE